MKNRKKTLTGILLLPLLFVVLLQGTLPFSALLLSGIKKTMEINTLNIDSHMVENRSVVLENAMVDQWSSIRRESDFLTIEMNWLLEEKKADMEQFMEDRELQSKFAANVYQELLDHLRRDTTCGVFLVLANGSDVEEAGEFEGFFLRDSDPTKKTDTDSDIFLVRGDKALARQSDLAFDSSWSPKFSLLGNGVRESDNFFYHPYALALENTDVDMENLGHWSMPFILEDHELDYHQMIAYSIPLIHDGVVYGVLGTEISTSYLDNSYFLVRDLDKEQNAGYALAIDCGDGIYKDVAGKGVLYDNISQEETFQLEKTEYPDLYRLSDDSDKNTYVVLSELKLYENHVPYENKKWVLCGFVTEESIFGLGNSIYKDIFLTIIGCAVMGMAIMFLIVRHVSEPVYRLMRSVRGGISGLQAFRPSGIAEIDELHRVIESLTESELRTVNQLNEEKERYKLAVESSDDMFFTYREKEHMIELVNSRGYDGSWQFEEFWDCLIDKHFSGEDQEVIKEILKCSSQAVSAELHLLTDKRIDGVWVEVNAKIIFDEVDKSKKVVGFVRDIHFKKMQELERRERMMLDPVTAFYRRDEGVGILKRHRKHMPDGVLMCIDIANFSYIVQNFGLTFGDVILEEFSWMIHKNCMELTEDPVVLIRAGSDEFLAWIPNKTEAQCRKLLSALREEFSHLIHKSALELDFYAGIVTAKEDETTEKLIERAGMAVSEAERQKRGIVNWNCVRDHVRKKSFGEVVSQGYLKEMGLVSLALNLFDRSMSLIAAMDLLARRLQSRYGIRNILITSYQEEYFSVSAAYIWKKLKDLDDVDLVWHIPEQHSDEMQIEAAQRRAKAISSVYEYVTLFREHEAMHCGIAFPMSDNNRYSGSVFMFGLDEEILKSKNELNLLWEIVTIIQNRINQIQHDQSAQAKTDFLSRMSHEIRTPMNGIIGMTEIALKENQTEESRVECLKKVQHSSNYLLGLLNDVLDMAKIESGKMELLITRFNLHDHLEELHPILDAQFAEKNQVYKTQISLKHSWFYGDAQRIDQILINLLGNAVKYSDSGTEILLTVSEKELAGGKSAVFFSVKDHGYGISAEDQLRIFQNFEQLDSGAARPQGTGLGLAISNRLVHMMGSSIHLESEVGKGSTFSFTLELEADTAASEESAEKDEQNTVDLTGRRILVAEDNELNMEILQFFLHELGCEADGAKNGIEAVRKFEQSAVGYYDLILMDIMMPEMDGLEAAHRIRLLDRSDAKSIPIIAISANAFEDDIKHSLESGMNGHISKPVKLEKLAETLGKVLQQKD